MSIGSGTVAPRVAPTPLRPEVPARPAVTGASASAASPPPDGAAVLAPFARFMGQARLDADEDPADAAPAAGAKPDAPKTSDAAAPVAPLPPIPPDSAALSTLALLLMTTPAALPARNPIQSQGHAQAQLAIPALPQSPIQGQGKNRAASQLGGKDGADGDIGDTGTSRANDAAAPVSLRALALALAPNAQASPLPVRAGGPSLAARNPCIDGVAVPDGALPDADPAMATASPPANNWSPAAPATDSVKLAGPAPQWQAPLREALGERIQLQVTRNSEQAVIRLDPPMLGRIDISIRHADGALQVTLSASNGEVLRQLQGIGAGLRQDLSQRHYSEVAVSVTSTAAATSRGPAGQAFGDADGRQRQSGRQPRDGEPGRALSEAGQPASSFALNQRES